MKLNLRITFFSLFFSICVFGQNMPVGEWIDYLPYNKVFDVAIGKNYVYGATEFGLIEFSKNDNGVLRFSKVEGISDIGITCIDYNENTESFFVGYSNGKIDLISEESITSNSDLFRKTISGNKSLNSVHMDGNFAFVATGFGVIKFDMMREEFSDTYIIGENGENIQCNDVVIGNDSIYVATEKGIRKAYINDPALVFFETWEWEANLPSGQDEINVVEFSEPYLYANTIKADGGGDSLMVRRGIGNWEFVPELFDLENNSIDPYPNYVVIAHEGNVSVYDSNWVELKRVFNYGTGNFVGSLDAEMDTDSTLWIGDKSFGLVKNPKPFSYEIIRPLSPSSSGVFDIDIKNNNMWVATGGYQNNGNNLFRNDGVLWRDSELQWGAITKYVDTVLSDVFDFVAVKSSPVNNSLTYAGSLGGGLVEFTDKVTTNIFDTTNSELKAAVINSDWVGVSGLDFDKQGNLWMANSRNANAIAVYTAEGEWMSYNFSNLLNDEITEEILVAESGYKWVIIPGQKGILVFDDGQTITDISDDQSRFLNGGSGTGGLPSNSVLSMAQDLDGEIWVGTSEGVGVFYSPGSVFSEGTNFDAQQIIVEVDGYFQYLLGTESVTAIAVDGADRKWFGTEGSGVFLMSSDGTQQLYHFTTDNSPLISNNIRTIKINSSTGEVIFGTDQGMIAFKGSATGDEVTTNQTYAYPNPVPENYTGLIAVKGLAANSDVRITDVAGNMVFSTIAEGTQVVWDGNDMNGNRVATGVYLVFGVDANGQGSQVAKILFTR